MPRTEAIKNSFVAGEISPYLLGRTDLSKYHSACESVSNFIVKVQGGVIRRWGTKYLVDANGANRLIPFVLSVNQSYVLEFGNQIIQFYVNDGQIASSNPAFNETLGGTTLDGTVTWTCRGTPNWIAAHIFNLGDIIIDSNGNLQQVTGFLGGGNKSGPTQPVWRSNIGGVTLDGQFISSGGGIRPVFVGIQWTCLGQPQWASKTAFYANAIYPTRNAILDLAGKVQQCTISGITGISSPYSITTPYTYADDLWDIHFVQIGSTMYLTHPNHPPMKLIRNTDTNWQLIQPNFFAPPNSKLDQDVGTQKSANITISGGNTATASNPVFIQGDVGKYIVAGTGTGLIISVSGTTVADGTTGATLYPIATIQIIDPFDLASYAIGNWKLRGGPQSYLAPGTFNSGTSVWRGSKTFGFGKQVPVRSATDHPTDGSWSLVSGGNSVAVTYNKGFTDSFRTLDVGLYIPFSGGYAQILSLGDSNNANLSTAATLIILEVPTVTEENANGNALIAPVPPGGWYLETPAFSVANGFPHAIAFLGDRLWLGGTLGAFPNTVWGSGVGDYENFALGTLDTAGIRFTLNSGELEHMHWMIAFGGSLVIGSQRSEYVVNGGAGQQVISAGTPITPSNINVNRQSRYGVDRIQAIMVDSDLFFIQKSKNKVYEFSFNAVISSYSSRDLNVLNEVITSAGMKEMYYQEIPHKVVWFTTLDNNLLGLTYSKEQDVWAWHRHFTGVDTSDAIISMTVIPGPDKVSDEVWLLCQRNRNGQTTYTIEVMDISLLVDNASHAIFNSPVSSVGNLQYLQGRPIFVVADGSILPSVTMDASGNYTFPIGFTAKDVQVGLNYTSSLLTVRPEPRITTQGLIKRWLKIWARLYASINLSINNQPIAFQSMPFTPGVAVPLFTGDVNINNLGFDRDARILVQQIQPAPCNLLALFGNLEVSDGI